MSIDVVWTVIVVCALIAGYQIGRAGMRLDDYMEGYEAGRRDEARRWITGRPTWTDDPIGRDLWGNQ